MGWIGVYAFQPKSARIKAPMILLQINHDNWRNFFRGAITSGTRRNRVILKTYVLQLSLRGNKNYQTLSLSGMKLVFGSEIWGWLWRLDRRVNTPDLCWHRQNTGWFFLTVLGLQIKTMQYQDKQILDLVFRQKLFDILYNTIDHFQSIRIRSFFSATNSWIITKNEKLWSIIEYVHFCDAFWHLNSSF